MAYGAILGQTNTTYTKDQILSSSDATLLGLSSTATPADMFNVLATVGDLHVWRRTFTEDQGKDAWYTLSGKVTGTFRFGAFNSSVPAYATYMYSDTLSVNSDGTFDLSDPSSITPYLSDNDTSICNNTLRGKFVKRTNDVYTNFNKNEIYFIPDDATFTFKYSSSGLSFQYINVDKYQTVTGHPAIPPGESVVDYPVSTNPNAYTEGTSAGTTIEYLGNLGDKARMQIVSYVGTGTYGESNPCSITADFPIKFAFAAGHCITSTGVGFNTFTSYQSQIWLIPACMQETYEGRSGFYINNAYSDANGKVSSDKKTITWYNDSDIPQLNGNGYTYYFLVIG